MKKFLLATIAAASLMLSVGSAFAAQTSNSGFAEGTWVNNQPPAFSYSPAGG